MEDRYKITYDSTEGKAFVVHLPNKQIRFTRSENGLHYYKPNSSTNNTSLVSRSIQSVDKNKKLYIDR
jgi:Holliday junction resolvase RusA-like endonuclease